MATSMTMNIGSAAPCVKFIMASSFFEYHIECFIGDRRLNSTQIETLDALVEFPVERVLELSARP